MHRRRHRSPAAWIVVAVLLALSLTAMLLPASWTHGLISLVQILVPFQDAAARTADAAARTLRGAQPADDACEPLARENAVLLHQTAALAARVEELEGEVRLLAATRLWEVDGRRLGARGRLIPARVVTPDITPWRSSRLVTAGRLQGVQRGAAVTTATVTVDQGESAGMRSGLAVLLGEALVGVIEQAGTHTSRVRLFSDVATQMKVRLGRRSDRGVELLDGYYWLVGRGGGQMEIGDVDARGVEAGSIQIDDIVLSDPMSENLPAALTIGRVAAIAPDRNNPLFAILTIEPAVRESALERVYVFDPRGE